MDKEEVDKLLKKLNYRGQMRVAVINGDNSFISSLEKNIEGLRVDKTVDPRFPYDFTIVFVQYFNEVEQYAAPAIHNLTADGVLWFAFPAINSSNRESDLDADHGWEFLTGRGFDKVRKVKINREWTALRFRNIRFIRSRSANSR
jgi:hypothetical protein